MTEDTDVLRGSVWGQSRPARVDPEAFAREAYREYRRANRPFRRAFGGIYSGERDRRILHIVGGMAALSKEAQS